MSFDWDQYLVLAKILAGHSGTLQSDEAKYRSAISRAYYSLHRKAFNFLRDFDGETDLPNHGGAHDVVKDKFLKSPIIQRRQIGLILDRLKKDRRKADYEDSFHSEHGLENTCLYDLGEASKGVSRLNSLLNVGNP